MWVFNYNGTYTDPSTGLLTKYMPKGYAFITDINARRDRYFGPEDHLPVTGDVRAWYADMFGVNMDAPSPCLQLRYRQAERRYCYYGHVPF